MISLHLSSCQSSVVVMPSSQNASFALSVLPFSLFKMLATLSRVDHLCSCPCWCPRNGGVSLLRTFTLRLCACTSGIKLISPFRDDTVAGGEVRDYVSVMWRHTHAVTQAEDRICTRSVSSLTFVHVHQLCCSLLMTHHCCSFSQVLDRVSLLLWNHKDYEPAWKRCFVQWSEWKFGEVDLVAGRSLATSFCNPGSPPPPPAWRWGFGGGDADPN